MKTTLTLLIAGLLFLTTPLIASAYGDRYDDGSRHYQTKVYDRHDQREDYRYSHRKQQVRNHQPQDLREARREMRQLKQRIARIEHKRDVRKHQRAKRQLQRELREARLELSQLKHRIKRIEHRRSERRHQRPYYAGSNVVVGFPNLIFRFDW